MTRISKASCRAKASAKQMWNEILFSAERIAEVGLVMASGVGTLDVSVRAIRITTR